MCIFWSLWNWLCYIEKMPKPKCRALSRPHWDQIATFFYDLLCAWSMTNLSASFLRHKWIAVQKNGVCNGLKLDMYITKSFILKQKRPRNDLTVKRRFYSSMLLSGYLMYIKPHNIYMCWTLYIFVYFAFTNCYCSNIIWHNFFPNCREN